MHTDLAQAFNTAVYRVRDETGAFELTIGQPCPPGLRPWITRYANTAWLITADNPAGIRLADTLNTARRDLLADIVHTRGLASLRCVNRDPNGDWPDEHGLLICGIEEGAARALGRRFGQLAIVAAGVSGNVALIWL